MDNIIIDYDDKSSRFLVSSPPWMVNKMRAIPNRRWDPKRRVWTAPAIRANVEYLLTQFKPELWTLSASNKAADVQSKKTVNRKRFPLSYEFKLPPMSHQLAGMDRVFGLDQFALFMQARTGKTKVIIDVFCAHNMAGDVDSLVIVCPNDLKVNWSKELEKNATVPYSVFLLETDQKKKFDAWVGTPHTFRVLIVAVETLAAGSGASMVERFMLTSTRVGMAIDESHKIKTHNASRSKECVRLGMLANKRAIATGTPCTKGYMDYFMQFEFLDPNIIGVGDFYSFRNRYAVMGGFDNKNVIGYQNTDELMELIGPYVYQVNRKDVYHELPEKEYEVRTVKLNKAQRGVYDQLRKSKKAEFDGESTEVANALTKMGRMQEICAGVYSYANPKYDGVSDKVKYHRKWLGSPKIDELLSLVEEEEGSIIVWAVYALEIVEICKALRAVYGDDQVVEVHGGIADKEGRDHNVRELFQKKKARFLVGNPAVGGVGHEMSAAETIVYMTNSFNYVDRSQSEDRASSGLQKNVVKVVDIMCEGTVDEIVKEAIDAKENVAAYVERCLREVISRI